jgi:hypothetical protein
MSVIVRLDVRVKNQVAGLSVAYYFYREVIHQSLMGGSALGISSNSISHPSSGSEV